MSEDEMIEAIESRTDYDVLNWSEFKMDVINRYDFDEEVITINIYNNSVEEIINKIQNL